MPRPYGRFARYYDEIYRGIVDYKRDCDYLEALFRRFLRRKPKSILDLGCGTGNHAIELARRGYEVTGLDVSESQLRIARQKVRGRRLPVTFVHANMRNFRLTGPFDVAINMFGGFGYLLPDRAVVSHFAAVRRHLRANGLYAFEFWQESGVRPGHQSWLTRERPHRILRLGESTYDRAKHRVVMDFQFYVFRGNRVVDRFSESHPARLYSVKEVRKMLGRAGMALSATYGATVKRKGFARVRKDHFRIMAAARPVPKLRAR